MTPNDRFLAMSRLLGVGLIIALLMALAPATLTAPASAAPASAAQRSNGGCGGMVTEYALNRSTDVTYRYHAGPKGSLSNTMRMSYTALVFRCTTRLDSHGHIVRAPERMKHFMTSLCATHVGGTMEWNKYLGFRSISRMRDDQGHVTIGDAHVGRLDGQYQSCENTVVPSAQQAWMETGPHHLTVMSVDWRLNLKRPLRSLQGLLLAHPVSPRRGVRVSVPHYRQPAVTQSVVRHDPPTICVPGDQGGLTWVTEPHRIVSSGITWNNCKRGNRQFVDLDAAKLVVQITDGHTARCHAVLGNWKSTQMRIKIYNKGSGLQTAWSNWHLARCATYGNANIWSLATYGTQYWRNGKAIQYRIQLQDNYYLKPSHHDDYVGVFVK